MATVEGSNKHTCLVTIGTQKERTVGHDEEKIYDYIMWISHKEKKTVHVLCLSNKPTFFAFSTGKLFLFFFCI